MIIYKMAASLKGILIAYQLASGDKGAVTKHNKPQTNQKNRSFSSESIIGVAWNVSWTLIN